MSDNSKNKQQNSSGRDALPGQTQNKARSQGSAASFSSTASAPANPLPSTISQKKIEHYCIGLPGARFFVQRDTLSASNLQDLAKDLADKRLQILAGMIGCGKTALARQYAFQHFQGQQGKFRTRLYASVFWLDATQGPIEETLERSFKTPMELQPGQSWLKEFTEKIRAYEVDLAKTEYWLLVIDGCDDPHHSQGYLHLAGYLLERTQRGHIILTTRRIPDQTQYTNRHMLREIENMTQEADKAEELLLNAYFDQPSKNVPAKNPKKALLDTETERQAATKLVAELWYHPLLICAAGKYMSEENKTPSYLLSLFPKEILQNPAGAKQNTDPFSRIFTTNLIDTLRNDYDSIRLNFPDSYQILMLCAFLNRERIPRQFIDLRPKMDASAPFYTSPATHPDKHIRPLRTVGFLRDDANGPFFHLNLIIRNIVYRRFQPRDTHTQEQIKVLNNELRQHQVYTIHTVSTVILGLIDLSKYDLYASHIMKCIKYLEEAEIQESIKSKEFMLDTVFRFLSTIGHYLRQHPESEGIYSISEIADANEKTLDMNRVHLFKLAFQIYHCWKTAEQTLPERKQILYTILPTLHEHFLYEQNRPELKKLESYYPALQELDISDDESIRAHHDLGCLKSDLNDFEGARNQFDLLYKKLETFLATANEAQKLSIIRWQAEIQISRAANWIRQAPHEQNSGLGPYTDAEKAYTSIDTLLLKLKGSKNSSEEFQKRVTYINERCQIGKVIVNLAIPEKALAVLTIEEVEKYRELIEKKILAIEPADYLTYLQLIVDLSNLAEVYRRLGKQEEQKGVPMRKNPFFEVSKDYSLCALTYYDYFYQIYPEMHLQVQVILQTTWDNYKVNPLYEGKKENEEKKGKRKKNEENKEGTPTKMLRELQEIYRKN